VLGVDPDPSALGRHSRYCSYEEGLSARIAERDVHGFIRELRALADGRSARPVLFPTNDAFIELLTPVAEELEEFARLSTDLARFGRDFLSKRRFYRLCRAQGVDLPKTSFLASADDLPAAEVETLYPAILKPVFVHRFRGLLGARKVVEVSNAAELRAAYSELSGTDPNFIVQEVIPGGDDRLWCAICYLGEEGRSDCVFVARKLRQFPPGFGSASLAESRWNSEVAHLSLRFLRGVGFRGFCATEYKEDPRDGRFKMIEVNARVPLWVSLAAAAGVDVPYVGFADLVGATCECEEQVDGVRWVFAAKDLSSAVHYALEGALNWSEWRASLRDCRAEAVWASDDPTPAFRLPFYLAARAARRLWKGAARRIRVQS
jgi:predicted ATP-grasp superfamily ATP-dependent carboligase